MVDSERSLGFVGKVALLAKGFGIEQESAGHWQTESIQPSGEFWLIFGTAGDYDDRQEWVVSVHTTEAEANAILAEFEAQRSAPVKRKNAFTRSMERPYMWADYHVAGPFTAVGTFFQGEYEY